MCFYNDFFFVHDVNDSKSSSKKAQFSCSDSEPFYRCNDGKMHEISKKIINSLVKAMR